MSCFRTYEINTGNFSHEPFNNTINYSNYYYPFNNNLNVLGKSNNYYNNHYTTSMPNNFNSFNNKLKNSFKTDYFNLYNSINKYNYNNNLRGTFTKDNIIFNNNPNKKIILTYEYKNISPLEISKKTDELINLQSQMCHLDSKEITNINGRRTKSASRPKNTKKTNNINNTYFNTQKNFKKRKNPFEKSFNNNKIKKNKTFSRSMTNKLFESKFNRNNSIEQNRTNNWKNKYLKVNDEIKDIKNKIKEVKNNNKILEKRLNYVKKKEEQKNLLYESNNKIKDYDTKLLEKYEISELIRKKQIDLIIKMQKEVNNMREKLKTINQYD